MTTEPSNSVICEGFDVDSGCFLSISTEDYDYVTVNLVGWHKYKKLPNLSGIVFCVLLRSLNENFLWVGGITIFCNKPFSGVLKCTSKISANYLVLLTNPGIRKSYFCNEDKNQKIVWWSSAVIFNFEINSVGFTRSFVCLFVLLRRFKTRIFN